MFYEGDHLWSNWGQLLEQWNVECAFLSCVLIAPAHRYDAIVANQTAGFFGE
jgi:hypothetical protein